MLRNYFLVGFRHLSKQLSYSMINITGLALGLATCLLLAMWISHELSYDRFHANASTTYRVSMEYSFGGQVARPSVSPNALLPALLTLPETKTGVRVYSPSIQNPAIIRNGDQVFEERGLYYADSTFFNVFTFDLLEGTPQTALREPGSIVLTEPMALKYFGTTDVLGKTLLINDNKNYLITAIAKDPPSNTVLQFDFIASFHSIAPGRDEPTWWSANYQTFVVLHDDASVANAATKVNDIVKEALANELTGEGDYVRYNFLPLTDIYLRSDFDEYETVSDIRYIYIFAGVTLIILVIACINYVNLATARAAGRAKEVGIRKVNGALRKQLFLQFIGESILVTAISFVAALLLAGVMLPLFNSVTGKAFSYAVLFQPSTLILFVVGMVIVALFAGAYPAIALTAFNPVHVLKGTFRTSADGIWLRKTLVIFQFGISAMLIAATLVIAEQLDFLRTTRLGYDRENIIVLPLDTGSEKLYESLETELKRTRSAISVARGSESPANIVAGYGINSGDREGPGIITAGLCVDDEYLPTVGIDLIQGRNFTAEDIENFEKDTLRTFILNEAALANLFIPFDEAIGAKVSLGGRSGEVVGVVRDFHFAPLHTAIGPLVIFPQRQQFEKILIRIPAGPLEERIGSVEKVYTSLIAHRPFEFTFLDDQYNSLYKAEGRMASIGTVFSTLAIIIACLGLFGLVSFSAEQKKKEIGIRKVLGATPSGIVALIGRDFSRLVLVAIALGLPFAYWLLQNHWLNEFAYRARVGIMPFALSAITCIVIALLCTAYQAIKASGVNPAETLRNE